MSPDVLIVGQGLAGTCLGCALEQAGISFAICDAPGAPGGTAAAAGIINPITGRRLVKSWRIDTLLPLAREWYRAQETPGGVRLWQDMRVQRLLADDGERAAFATKERRGELLPFVDGADDAGFWIRDAARVDLQEFVRRARTHWQARGEWRGEQIDIGRETERHALVIDCRGVATVSGGDFDFVPWEVSKGEVLEIAVDGLAPDVIVNRRHWVLPTREGVAWVGATHEPGVFDPVPTAAGRGMLEASARELLRRPFAVTGHRAGVRVNLPDKRPVAGRHPKRPRLGLMNGLGAKGALTAPWLARQWADHLASGLAFDREIDVSRFAAIG